ncbi:hypothetical protein [Thioclava sp. GXIMD4216]|uniref:hypothetical protein n=1 Tax=Thioclava sp. GXIMD4216 TaxID=3131929 RepID=UPI0030CD0EAA
MSGLLLLRARHIGPRDESDESREIDRSGRRPSRVVVGGGDLSKEIEAEIRAEYQNGFDSLSSASKVAADLVATIEPSIRPVVQNKLNLLKKHLSAAGRFAARVMVGRDRQVIRSRDAKKYDERDEI